MCITGKVVNPTSCIDIVSGCLYGVMCHTSFLLRPRLRCDTLLQLQCVLVVYFFDHDFDVAQVVYFFDHDFDVALVVYFFDHDFDVALVVYFFDHDFDVALVVYFNCQNSTRAVRVLDGSQQKAHVVKTDYSDSLLMITRLKTRMKQG